jgi:hypothetical protein
MDIKRIAAVTGGLAVAGAVVGAVVGMVALAAWRVMVGDTPAPEDFGIGAVFGAGMGAVLGPLAAWMLMRHVPIGLALGGTALGTLAGAIAGLLISHGDLMAVLIHGLIGFAIAAVVLRIATARRAVPRAPSA